MTKPVLPPDIATTETSMLETVLQYGTARSAAIGQFAAGKTGTTSNYGDAWFVGWDSKYTVAVWVGYPNGLVPMTTQFNGGPVLGGTFPALIWHDFMISALHIDKTRAERAVAAAAARAAGKTHGQSTTSTSEETIAPSSGSPGASQSGEEGAAERHSSPNTGGGGTEHGSSPSAPAAPAPSSPPAPASPSPRGKLARAQRRRRRREPGSDGRSQRQPVGRGLDTWRLPAMQNRHGNSTALVIPTRVPTTTGSSHPSAGAQTLIGPRRRSPPFSDSQMPSAWVSLPGPEHSSVSLTDLLADRRSDDLRSVVTRPRLASRRARISSIPSSGSSALISTAAPTPCGSQTALSSA